jgi:hypothetical protein
MRNRLASETDYVMLDENLVNELSKTPLYIRPHSKVDTVLLRLTV